jgi:hypothetical protein
MVGTQLLGSGRFGVGGPVVSFAVSAQYTQTVRVNPNLSLACFNLDKAGQTELKEGRYRCELHFRTLIKPVSD